MNWLKRPQVWFPLALGLLVIAGALSLNNPTCQSLDERDWRWFSRLNTWRSTFDAVSAACGVGLLTHEIDEEYTAVGKWGLSAIGLAGAFLWIAAAASASRQFWGSAGAAPALPRTRRLLAAFAGLVLLSIPLTALVEWRMGCEGALITNDGVAGSAWRAISAVASLGWLPGEPPRPCTWIYAALGLAAGLGWMLWLLPFGRQREYLRLRAFLKLAGGYVLYLLVLAGLIFVLESPRTTSATSTPSAPLTGQPALDRYPRALDQTICAATAGIPVEDLSEHDLTDGSKMVLGGSILIGSLGGSPGAGIKWTLLVWFVSAGIAATCIRRQSLAPAGVRCFTVATGYITLLVTLTLVTAFGLLAIETYTARSYQERPTFAAAFLDASSAVGGANISTGLAHTVTDGNLSRGIRQDVDSYQYGMVLLMAAMLIGRMLPILVLGRLAGLRLIESESVRSPAVI